MLLKYNRDAIINEVKRIIKTSHVKRENKARKFEKLEMRRAADRYINAYYKTDSLLSYPDIDRPILEAAGFTDEETIQELLEDRYKIPKYKIEAVLTLCRERVMLNYVEKNNYYRELMGLPPLDPVDDTKLLNEITLTPKECFAIGAPPNTKIHDLTDDMVERLRSTGAIDAYKEKFPHYGYLNHLGDDSIPIHVSRRARNFELIRFITNDAMSSFDQEFLTTYTECREYFMEIIYNRNSSAAFVSYEDFIGLMIMIMSIHRVFTKQFKMGIERDFFDLDSIEGIFDTYRIPFLGEMSIDTKRAVMKNINRLLRFKATDTVLFDILSIFGYDNAIINELYLTKEHKLDPHGRPIFLYKQVALNPDRPTELTTVLDKEKMYNLYFRAVDKKDINPLAALTNDVNRREYYEVTDSDPDWIEDAALKEYLMDAEFNYIKTKYIDISVMQRLTKIQFESIILFKMMLDKKRETSAITLTLPRITGDDEVSLFEATLLCLALISKSMGMAGNIITSPSMISSVIGYNFNIDLGIIKTIVNKSPLKNTNILSLLPKGDIDDAASLNKLFSDILNFAEYLNKAMAATSDIEEYNALKRIWDILYISQMNKELFRKRDGSIARTYKELLIDMNPKFADAFTDDIDSTNIITLIDHVISSINKLIPNAKYIKNLNSSTEDMALGIMEMLRRFKSLTTKLKDYALIYVLDSRLFNMIYVKDNLHHIIKERGLDDRLMDKYADALSDIMKLFVLADRPLLYDSVDVINGLTLSDRADISFKLMAYDGKEYIIEDLGNVIQLIVEDCQKVMSESDVIALMNIIYDFGFIREDDILAIREQFSWESKHIIQDRLSPYLALNRIESLIRLDKEDIPVRERIRIIREMDDGSTSIYISGDTNQHSKDSYSYIAKYKGRGKPNRVKDYTNIGYGTQADGSVPKPQSSTDKKTVDPDFPYGSKN